MSINVTAWGFPDNEVLKFEGDNLREVHRQFGRAVSIEARQKLTEVLQTFEDESQIYSAMSRAESTLRQLENRAADGSLVFKGINWLQRYLDAFYGYSEGTGLHPSELALLQAEVLAGCQTMIVQDKQTREIRFIHTEEDAEYSLKEMSDSPARLVTIKLPEQEILFFGYPGLCSWGPAYSINKSKGLVQLVDDNRISDESNQGPFWANAISFMTLDCGDQEVIDELLERAATIDGGFFNGYALNLIDTNYLQVKVLEFARNQVSQVTPSEVSDRLFYVHANCPVSAEQQPFSETGTPPLGQEWKYTADTEFVQMRLRHQMLEAKAVGTKWLGLSPYQSLKVGFEILASPEGDVGGYVDENGHEHWKFLMSIPSNWNLSSVAGYVGSHESVIGITRFNPPPLPDKEFSLTAHRDFPFARRKLWNEMEKAKLAHAQGFEMKHPGYGWTNSVIIPSKLQPGDEIRVITPSSSMDWSDLVQVRAKERLEALGFKVSFGKHVYEKDALGSSSIASRIEDLHSAFLDPNVKAIFSADGGFNSNGLLRYIDWDIIRNNPKIFTGYSDITALQSAILEKTGLVTYSGALYWSIGKDSYYEYTQSYLKKCLFDEQPFEVKPSFIWGDDSGEPGERAAEWIGQGHMVINEGEAVGRIIGGNISTLALLKGTEFFPNLENSILFLEDDYEYKAHHIDRELQALLHLPDFIGVRAIVFGKFEAASKTTPQLLKHIIRSKKELRGIPIVSNVEFGHTYPKITLPIGGTAYVKAEDNQVILKILTH